MGRALREASHDGGLAGGPPGVLAEPKHGPTALPPIPPDLRLSPNDGYVSAAIVERAITKLAHVIGAPTTYGSVVQRRARVRAMRRRDRANARQTVHLCRRWMGRLRAITKLMVRIVAPATHGAGFEQSTRVLGTKRLTPLRSRHRQPDRFGAHSSRTVPELAFCIVPPTAHSATIHDHTRVPCTKRDGSGPFEPLHRDKTRGRLCTRFGFSRGARDRRSA